MFDRRKRRPVPAAWDDSASFEESMRILRTRLSVVLTDLDRPRVVVTSATEGEGKTTTCVHAGIAFAAAGTRTVIVDLDLRHPNAHRLLGGHNEFGVSDVLLHSRPVDEVMQYVTIPGYPGRNNVGLYLLSTGAAVSNPAELLGSGRTARLLDRLADQADLVLVDTPPVLPVADTLVIGRIASGALLVTEARATAITAVQKAKDQLVQNQTRLLGVVINKFQARDAPTHYGYGHGYGYPRVDEPEVGRSNGHAPSMTRPTDTGP